MARSFALLLLVAQCTCMETRETVQRMVMVRTTGSDLQPAATGFIYKKESDGPASVVEMGESEVMEQLTKLYEQPKSFAAPIPVAAGPFYAKDDKSLPSSSESKVIPVIEKQDDEHIAGTVNEDYEKILSDYATNFKPKPDFDEYLKSVGYFEHGVYHDHTPNDAGSEHQHKYGDKEKKEYGAQHKHETSGASDYDTAKYESYATSSGESSPKKGTEHAHDFEALYPLEPEDKSDYEQGEAGDGFHDLFLKDEHEKDNDYDDEEAVKGGLHKVSGGHAPYESDTGGAGASDEAGLRADFGQSGFYDGRQHPAEQHHGALGAGGARSGSSFHYKVSH